mgnify:CR=1 FL=1
MPKIRILARTWETRLKDLNMTTKELQVAIGTPSREIVRRWLRGDFVAIEDKLYRASLNKVGKVKV